MNKLHINKLFVVEGKYDKIKLSNIVDSDIFVVNGFSAFKNKNIVDSIKSIAANRDIIILTDSDSAGYKIRVHLSKILSGSNIINVFAPQIHGKEKRKNEPSAEGYYGIEGIADSILIELLSVYESDFVIRNEISISDLFRLGYTGTPNASAKKKKLLNYLNLPSSISNNFLLKILNERFDLEQFANLKI